MKRIKTILILLLLYARIVYGQELQDSSSLSLYNLSLEELFNTEVTVAGTKATSINQSPGIISVITHEEIEKSGARDLLDLLNQIPGIDFGAEWDNVIGIGIRGNNATEGKILVLYDDHELNETNFGIFSFGQHILLNNIERIEIIRGPGSVKYGGSAELCVIKIISKTGKGFNGASASVDYGFSNNKTSRYNLQSSFGKSIGEDFSIAFSARYGVANRSNRMITTLDSTAINYADSSAVENAAADMLIRYKTFSFSMLYDRNRIANTEAMGSILFEGFYVKVQNDFKLSNKVSFIPSIRYKNQKPWYFLDFQDKSFYNTTNSRTLASLPFNYSVKNLTILIGAEATLDRSVKSTDSVYFSANGETSFGYNTYSGFSEIQYFNKFVNVNIGARYDYNSIYGGAFTPRISLNKEVNKANFKAIISRAYKAPTISNIDYNLEIKPEETHIFEFESGYKFTNDMKVSVSLYTIYILNPILYIPNPTTGLDYYQNYPKSGSRGIEAEYKILKDWGFINAGYAFYKKNTNLVPQYDIATNNNTFGGYPMHKASFLGSFILSEKLSFAYNVIFYGKRYTYVHSDVNWSDASLIEFHESYNASIYFTYRNAVVDGFNISLGVYDVTAQQHEYINAYNGWQNPIPAQGRELTLKLTYNFKNSSDEKE